MRFRRFAAFCLLVAGITTVLVGGNDGINGYTIAGVLLAFGGIVLAD